jgi:16S rRNA processing protein RimM
VSAKTEKLVVLGRIGAAHGVSGWVKVHSYTEPRDNIIALTPWVLRGAREIRTAEIEDARSSGRSVVVKLVGVDDRDRAATLSGSEIVVPRGRLPPCEPGEYYWADLEGLEVRDPRGAVLGEVDHLLATGSNDVLVLRGDGERMIPFVVGKVIRSVDLEAGVIIADWAIDY